nr:hypothetical protein [Tanacetum cinerariifolium]
MVTVLIHQDTSSVPPMTTPVLDLTTSQSNSPTVNASHLISTETTTTIATTTTLSPPPPQPQQSTTYPILLQRIGELEQHMENLIQDKLALEERLNKHRSRLYNLEDLNITQKVSKAIDKIVTNAVDWAMQAPLRARFSDLPAKSLERDYSNQLLADLDEARRKKRKKRDLPRTPSGSPPPQPPPPPPPAGASGAISTSRASGSTQLPTPPPTPSTDTNQGNQQQGNGALSSSKSAALTPQSMAWTTSDTRYESAGFAATHETSPADYLMNDDSILNEHVHFYVDEDTENDHLPKVDMRKDWWKPLPEEERSTTPEPA